jgi:hypothetical protein
LANGWWRKLLVLRSGLIGGGGGGGIYVDVGFEVALQQLTTQAIVPRVRAHAEVGSDLCRFVDSFNYVF